MLKKPSKESTEYWEQVLHDHRLGMNRGKSSKVDYAGGEEDLKGRESQQVSKKFGKIGKRNGPE